MFRTLISSLALAAVLGSTALAQAAAPVYCGSITCFSFRVSAAGKDADARANQAMDTINKYLGGKVGKVSSKPDGKSVRILLNNELVAVVTPADAAAEKQTVSGLAAKWQRILAQAFNQSKAQPG